ncbi:MAG: peptide ABC transporter ATP-binding protein [Lentisphaerae bacterium GWF2_57_35]|nr:MAG: peptide ABC transporter ATP-binding protein [Lentisphaerae bacterium GWF2_57_35]
MAHVLDIEDLRVSFDTDDGEVRAVNGVSFHVNEGEVLGLVGESGCGKTVTALSVLRLIPSPPGRVASGRIVHRGRDLLSLPIQEMRSIRGSAISMIFQEPMSALSPLHRVGGQLMETLMLHRPVSRKEAWRTSVEWLDKVGIPDPAARMDAYPFQLSGGMRQRVMIAMALMLDPELVIADEPTTALDVTVQAQIFDLLLKMKSRKTAILLITHDMGVVWNVCDRVHVMYASKLVEKGPRKEIFEHPRHPYTQGLLKAMPRLYRKTDRLPAIKGQVPSPLSIPSGCPFRDRCPFAFWRCPAEVPPLYPCGEEHEAACFLIDPEGEKNNKP